jgi:hypothetical protein
LQFGVLFPFYFQNLIKLDLSSSRSDTKRGERKNYYEREKNNQNSCKIQDKIQKWKTY